MHNGWVTVDGEKMSKSLGNFTSLTDLLDRSDARSYRLLVLRSHYRSPIEVTPETVADAESGLARLDEMARRFGIGDLLAGGPVVDPAVCGDRPAARSTPSGGPVPGPHGRRPRHPGRPGHRLRAGAPGQQRGRRRRRRRCRPGGGDGGGCSPRPSDSASGSEETADVDPATAELVRRRDEARAAGSWDEADTLRGELEAAGWVVEDGPEGTRIRRQ